MVIDAVGLQRIHIHVPIKLYVVVSAHGRRQKLKKLVAGGYYPSLHSTHRPTMSQFREESLFSWID